MANKSPILLQTFSTFDDIAPARGSASVQYANRVARVTFTHPVTDIDGKPLTGLARVVAGVVPAALLPEDESLIGPTWFNEVVTNPKTADIVSVDGVATETVLDFPIEVPGERYVVVAYWEDNADTSAQPDFLEDDPE